MRVAGVVWSGCDIRASGRYLKIVKADTVTADEPLPFLHTIVTLLQP